MAVGNVLIMAGGTGGHVFPALACAREFQARGYTVHWLGTPRGIENELVPAAGLKLHLINVTGLRGKGVCPCSRHRSCCSRQNRSLPLEPWVRVMHF